MILVYNNINITLKFEEKTKTTNKKQQNFAYKKHLKLVRKNIIITCREGTTMPTLF